MTIKYATPTEPGSVKLSLSKTKTKVESSSKPVPATIEDDKATKLVRSRKVAPGRSRKQRFSLRFSPISYLVGEISGDVNELVRYIETYLNVSTRPKTAENINLARLVLHISSLDETKRSKIVWEDLCVKFNVAPEVITASIAGGLYLENLSLARFKAAKGAPLVVDAIVDRAQTPKGHADSRLLMEMVDLADSQAAKVTIGAMIGQQVVDNSTNNTNVLVGIPDFMGDILAQESSLRENYVRALEINNKANLLTEGSVIEPDKEIA